MNVARNDAKHFSHKEPFQIGMLGNVKCCTLPAYGEKEMEAILKKA